MFRSSLLKAFTPKVDADAGQKPPGDTKVQNPENDVGKDETGEKGDEEHPKKKHRKENVGFRDRKVSDLN